MDKKLIMGVLLASGALVACSTDGNRACTAKNQDSRVETYQGVLPSADAAGIRYVLTLEYDSADGGDYHLTRQYLDGNNKVIQNYEADGDFTVMRVRPNGEEGEFLKLEPDHVSQAADRPADVLYFIRDSDTALTLVGPNLQRAMSGLNYTITSTSRISASRG